MGEAVKRVLTPDEERSETLRIVKSLSWMVAMAIVVQALWSVTTGWKEQALNDTLETRFMMLEQKCEAHLK